MEYPVSILERGRRWELETGEDAAGITDFEGILAIEEYTGDTSILRECDDCGDEVEELISYGGCLLCEGCYDSAVEEEEEEEDDE